MEQTAQNSLKLTSLLLSLLSALVVGYDSDYFSKIKILLKPILLLSVLSIIELYNYESRGGFVGRNSEVLSYVLKNTCNRHFALSDAKSKQQPQSTDYDNEGNTGKIDDNAINGSHS